MSKPKVLVFTKYYLPGFKAGGPIRSVSNMVKALSENIDFYIVTSDRDSQEKEPYPNVKINEWTEIDHIHIFYTNKKFRFSDIKQFFKERDYKKLYLNSFLSPYFSILPLIAYKFLKNKTTIKEVILAPRGEMAVGALNLKPFKKKVLIKFYKQFGIHKNVTWQASSQYEKDDILQVFPNIKENITIIPNVPDTKDNKMSFPEFRGTLKIICVARIAPVKNIDLVIEALSQCKTKIEFNIYGLLDDKDYWKKLQDSLNKLPRNITIEYRGFLDNLLISEELKKHHLFFLPTAGENYGHAIAESFLNGIPVLISDQTPWRNLMENNVGWDLPLDNINEFSNIIDAYYDNLKKGEKFDPDAIREWFLKETDYDLLLKSHNNLFSKTV